MKLFKRWWITKKDLDYAISIMTIHHNDLVEKMYSHYREIMKVTPKDYPFTVTILALIEFDQKEEWMVLGHCGRVKEGAIVSFGMQPDISIKKGIAFLSSDESIGLIEVLISNQDRLVSHEQERAVRYAFLSSCLVSQRIKITVRHFPSSPTKE